MSKEDSQDTKAKDTRFEWHLIDASTQPLGRAATGVAELLLGKHRPDFAPHLVAPVRVVVVNTDKVKVTGNKLEQKMYRHYTGHPGGLKERSLSRQLQLDSREVFEQAVSGMLPKNSLRAHRLQNLLLYKGTEHPHQAQIK
ncbi:MAG: 50S ribosomal protein L13 [Candidatus Andersenbacteria bacterium]